MTDPAPRTPPAKLKPITETKIPGTEVPDVHQAATSDGAENERQKQWMARVAVSTAVMAAVAAIGSSMATGHLNEAMFQQIREADQWSFYQAKGIKETVLEGRIETAEGLKQPVSDADRAKLKRYGEEKAGIKKDAESCRALSDGHMRKYTNMSRAATAAQIGIALAAVALLLRKNIFWALSLVAGAVGAAFLIIGLLGGAQVITEAVLGPGSEQPASERAAPSKTPPAVR